MFIESVAAWLVTIFLHLGLLLGLARFLTSRLDAGLGRERLWRLALCGALLTASAQTMLGSGPLVWRMPQSIATPATTPVALAGSSDFGASRAPGARRAPLRADGARQGSATTTLSPASWSASRVVGISLVSLWLLGVLFVGFRQHRARTRFVAGLKRKRLSGHAELRDALQALLPKSRSRQSVRLSVSEALSSPVVLSADEICLPARALTEFSPRELKATLAHELAHVLRRDPLWMRVYAALEALFFFQPLVKRATGALRAEAELACDDWAVGRGADPLGLAHSLARIAAWAPTTPVGLTAMVGHESGLVKRVQRLTSVPTSSNSRLRATWCSSVLLAGLGIFACAGPGVSHSETAREDSTDALDSSSLVLKLKKDGSLRADAERFTLPADWPKLRTLLRSRSALNSMGGPGGVSQLRVVLDIDAGVRFLEVQRLMQELANAKIWLIDFAMDERGIAVPLLSDLHDVTSGSEDFASESGESVQLSLEDVTAGEQDLDSPNPRPVITMQVVPGPPRRLEYRVDAKEHETLQAMAILLARTLDSGQLERILINCHRGVLYGDVIALLDALNAAGLGGVPYAFVGTSGEK